MSYKHKQNHAIISDDEYSTRLREGHRDNFEETKDKPTHMIDQDGSHLWPLDKKDDKHYHAGVNHPIQKVTEKKTADTPATNAIADSLEGKKAVSKSGGKSKRS